jgi:hypothetical protein
MDKADQHGQNHLDHLKIGLGITILIYKNKGELCLN